VDSHWIKLMKKLQYLRELTLTFSYTEFETFRLLYTSKFFMESFCQPSSRSLKYIKLEILDEEVELPAINLGQFRNCSNLEYLSITVIKTEESLENFHLLPDSLKGLEISWELDYRVDRNILINLDLDQIESLSKYKHLISLTLDAPKISFMTHELQYHFIRQLLRFRKLEDLQLPQVVTAGEDSEYSQMCVDMFESLTNTRGIQSSRLKFGMKRDQYVYEPVPFPCKVTQISSEFQDKSTFPEPEFGTSIDNYHFYSY